MGAQDGKFFRTCTPKEDQEAFHDGQYNRHGIHFQNFTFPNGVFGLDGFVAKEGDNTARTKMNMDALLDSVPELRDTCLLYDGVYARGPHVMKPLSGRGRPLTVAQQAYNAYLRGGRIVAEWTFNDLDTYWAHLGYHNKHQMLKTSVVANIQVCGLFTNWLNCFRPSETCRYFGAEDYRPTISGYMT